METNSTQQEIILIAGTKLSSQGFYQTSEDDSGQLTEKEKLKLACRNGLLPHILPEIFEQHPANKKLHLWEMSEDSLFIEVKTGEIYVDLEMEFSIDPYSFLAMQILS